MKILKQTSTEVLSVEPDYKYQFPQLLSLNKNWITAEMKIKFVFGFLMNFYVNLTPILNIFNTLFISASFGKLRLYSCIGRKLLSVIFYCK